MFSSADLIEALHRRRRRSIRPLPPPGEFPPGWRDWFAAMAARPGRVAGATAAELVAAAGARMPPPPAGIVAELGRWRAFVLLWRHEWQPASSDERWARIAATSGSLLLHLLFAVAMVWLMLHRFHFPAPQAEARDGEEHVLQVEYIGEGTPADAGGGAPGAPVESPPRPPAPAAPATPTASPAPAPRPGVGPAPPVAVEVPATPERPVALPPSVPERELVLDLPEPAPATVPMPDVLQVTEVEVPDSRFVVPPPREPALTVPAAAAPDVAVQRRAIELQDAAVARPPLRTGTRGVEVAAPQVAPRDVEVAPRRVELARSGQVAAPPVRSPPLIETGAATAAPSVPERAVPMPSSRALPEERTAAPAGSTPGGRPDGGDGARSAAVAPGAGERPGQPPGAPSSTRASDDWGDSTRNAPGRQAGTPGASGLFNADGSPRLAGGGAAGGGLPPGTITEDFENIDRHGTWLKRPPYDYEPTAFDRFWMPGETLLEEWVRRSITEVRIPIPGTTKTIRCVTVVLALGGACGIVDPNLQEQPPGARPPPDVPFKPGLQEDQDSL